MRRLWSWWLRWLGLVDCDYIKGCERCGAPAENMSSQQYRPIYRCEEHSRLIHGQYGDYRIPS